MAKRKKNIKNSHICFQFMLISTLSDFFISWIHENSVHLYSEWKWEQLHRNSGKSSDACGAPKPMLLRAMASAGTRGCVLHPQCTGPGDAVHGLQGVWRALQEAGWHAVKIPAALRGQTYQNYPLLMWTNYSLSF